MINDPDGGPKGSATATEPLPPHLPLDAYYSDETERRRFLGRIFDQTARHYDRISSFLSLGTGEWYRAFALRRAGVAAGSRILDVATGTGLVARPAARLAGPSGLVVGLDPSAGMLSRFRERHRVRLARGIAEQLPFRDAAFDFLTMGYALRHVKDLLSTFVEYRRVLRRGGRLLVLDFLRPRGAAGYGLARLFLHMLVPLAARLFSGGRDAELLMRYCWDTVDQSVDPQRTAAAIREAGFVDLRVTRWAGVFVEYAAVR
jgi:demethylmenaquinone methyltransferase/2-methoxy-6-polyprenyl-1,4-benzoquinol methylase